MQIYNQQQCLNLDSITTLTEPFPIQLLPPVSRDAAIELSLMTGISLSLIVIGIIGAMSLSTQGLYEVSPAPGQIRPTSIYAIGIAPPGTGKTPIVEKTFKPFFEYEDQLEKKYKNELIQYKVEIAEWTLINKKLEKQILTNASDENLEAYRSHIKNMPKKPEKIAITFSDISAAGLTNEIRKNNKTIGLVSAEADEILNSDLLKNSAQILKLWGGERSRKTRFASDNNGAKEGRLTMVSFINPMKFKEFSKRNGKDSHETGLNSRIIYVSTNETRTIPSRGVKYSEEKLTTFHEAIWHLLDMTFSKENEKNERTCLIFSEEATEYWFGIHREVKEACAPGGDFSYHLEYAAKWPDMIARIAALLHIFDKKTGEISTDTLIRSEKICSWFADEFMEIFPKKHAEITLQEKAEKLRAFIMAECQKLGRFEIPYNHILQYGRDTPRGKKERDEITDYLIQQGLVRKSKIGRITYISPSLPL
jgi:hypothetical protein